MKGAVNVAKRDAKELGGFARDFGALQIEMKLGVANALPEVFEWV
jgi:hypothetical protein